MNFVYLTTNLVNGKQYVGSHEGDENDSYLGSGFLLEKARSKYGDWNFERKILKKTKTREESFKLEKYYIKKFNTLQPTGYNISPTGGMNEWGGKHSEETKQKISNTNKGKIPWSKGVYFSESHKNKISKSKKGNSLSEDHKEKIKRGLQKYKKDKFKNLNEEELKKKRVGKYNNFYGNTHKNEKNYKEKYTTRKGITPTNALRVKNMKTGKIFNSLAKASEEFDNPSTARRAISDVCKGRRESFKNIKYKFV